MAWRFGPQSPRGPAPTPVGLTEPLCPAREPCRGEGLEGY